MGSLFRKKAPPPPTTVVTPTLRPAQAPSARPQSQDEYREVDPKLCKGEPPGVAFCMESSSEFELEWDGPQLTIRYQGELLTAHAFSSDGRPRCGKLEPVSMGESFRASDLLHMTRGMSRLRLQRQGEVYVCKLRMDTSAGHGNIETWVSLTLDPQSRTARYESYEEYDDCR